MQGKGGGQLDLSIREWESIHCGSHHDHDVGARKKILVPLLLS
ncbi:MAG: hypothetical protein QNJ74_17295 [Trichodesmium sp. MO_231.B1]|nr:hypothetical protein [Trichodesmium sp. MO_231.B1]